MTIYSEPIPVPSERLAHVPDPLRLAVAAYLARFKGSSRYHTDSDLRCYLTWCAERGLNPLAARRPHLDLTCDTIGGLGGGRLADLRIIVFGWADLRTNRGRRVDRCVLCGR